MATLINNAGVQHYANKMVLAENRKVGSKSLPTALSDIDNLIDEMKTQFDAEYGSELDMKLENNENIFSVGTGSGVDKKADVENSFTDVELFGNSLVNLNKYSLGSFTVSESKYYTPEKSLCDLSQLKNNTDYTLIIDYDIKDGSSDRYNTCELVYADAIVHYGQNFIINNKKGVNVFKFTTRESFPIESTKLAVRFIRLGSGSPIEGEQVTADIKNVLLLEGDYTNKPIPNYFEGMKSVGEVEGNKIEILSQNENLFDNTKAFQGYVTSDGQLTNRTHNNIRSDYISIKPNTYYSVLCDGASSAHNYSWFDSNKVFIQRDTVGNKCISPSNAHYLIYHNAYVNDNSYVDLDSAKITLTIGQQVPTQHIVHKSNKKEISLNEPLRGLPNGIKDTIEKINGEWKIVRRCGEVVLDGSEDWGVYDFGIKDTTRAFSFIDSTNPRSKQVWSNNQFNSIITNNLKVVGSILYLNDCVGVAQGYSDTASSNQWLISIPISSMNTNDSIGFKDWLSANNVKIIYELITPIIEDISPVTLQCWKNGTISIDEILPVETTHTVALNKPAQIKRNIEELTVLRKRVQALEDFYDQVALEQAHQLSLTNHSIELDYNI